jgi:hypothetical protein
MLYDHEEDELDRDDYEEDHFEEDQLRISRDSRVTT